MIDSQLAAFLEDGVGIHIGTRNDRLEPSGARAVSVRVEPGGTHFVVFLTTPAAERVLPDLEANGHAAVVFARPMDERACQVKGTFAGSRAVTAADRVHAAQQWNAFLQQLEHIGIPRTSVSAWLDTPTHAIRLKATAVYEQTPGPDAGKQLS